MTASRKIVRHGRRLSALERIAGRLDAHDAAWYAERINRLGLAMFGDLWEPRETTAPMDTNQPEATNPQTTQA